MKTLKVQKWDMADYINTKEDIIAHLDAALEETDFSRASDLKYFLAVLGDIARSKGMAKIAQDLRLSREGLYQSLSPDGNPSFATVMGVLNSLGFRLSLKNSA